jgi:ABC-2 type transport system ATP-binding protein
MSSVIKLTDLTKSYGKSRGIVNVNLDVPKGSIFGFLGPNGAGKTTTISILVDLIRATNGKAEVFGKDTSTHGTTIRNKIGYLAGDMALDGSLTGMQQLDYFSNLRGKTDKKYIKQLAEKLDCDLNKKIKTLSRGNKQKIGLISALMHNPELLILDEPTSGLDPLIQEQFNSIILEHKSKGHTTFISSHILSEVQELCDFVAFIKDGKIVSSQPIGDLSINAPYQVTVVSDDKKLGSMLKKLPEVHASESAHKTFNFTYIGDVSKLISILSKYPIIDVSITKGDLESVFMKYYKDDNAK